MRKLGLYLFALLNSALLGFSIFYLTVPYVAKDIGTYNKIGIDFTYVNNEADFTIIGFNEKSEEIFSTKRFCNISKNIVTETEEKIQVVMLSTLIPYTASHKIEFKFEGMNNILYIEDISINGKALDVSELYNNLSSSQNFRKGKSKNGKGFFIELLESEVTFDVTNIYKPLKLTSTDIEMFWEDYRFLYLGYLFFCIALTFLFLLISYLFLTKKLKLESNEIFQQDASCKLYFYNTVKSKIYYIVVLVITVLLSIHTSYYVLLDGSFSNVNNTLIDTGSIEQELLRLNEADANRTLNIMLYEQNHIPIFCLILLFFALGFLFKKRVIRIITCFVPLVLSVIFIVDNCVLNVLGTRFNFKFGGDYGGEIQYFSDFIVKYVLSPSGLLMTSALIICFVLCFLVVINNQIIICKKLFLLILGMFIGSSVWGITPVELRNGNFKFANVFQINDFCLQKFGNFEKNYEHDYVLRDNMQVNWMKRTGLNQKKNVILVLVESLGCNFTYICGSGPSYMPNLEKIASENLYFDNYYSIIPSTSMSYLSIIKGVPVIQPAFNSKDEESMKYSRELYTENDLISHFRNNGYNTKFISSTDHVFGMKQTIDLSSYDEIIDANNESFNKIEKRYVFNSVTDEDLFNFIIKSIKKDKQNGNFFYATKTASNHSPYNSPLGFNDINKAFEYTDLEISKFIKKLEEINYFQNGIVVLVGDHHAWSDDGILNTTHVNEVNKVPLIIIDGNKQASVNHTELSHTDLGQMLQYLELPEYKFNQFNVNPWDNPEGRESLIFGYDYSKISLIEVKRGVKETYVIASGNESEFINKKIFTEKEQKEILGYISRFRR